MQSRPVEMEANGLSIGAPGTTSASSQSSRFSIARVAHGMDPPAATFAVCSGASLLVSLTLRLNQNTGPGVLSARDSLQPWKAESKRSPMSEIGGFIMILMHVNTVTCL